MGNINQFDLKRVPSKWWELMKCPEWTLDSDWDLPLNSEIVARIKAKAGARLGRFVSLKKWQISRKVNPAYILSFKKGYVWEVSGGPSRSGRRMRRKLEQPCLTMRSMTR